MIPYCCPELSLNFLDSRKGFFRWSNSPRPCRIYCRLRSRYTIKTTASLRATFSQHEREKGGKGKTMADIDTEKVIAVLNQILERELAGVVRYTHYSFLVFGFGRIPLVSWLREQASESLAHAQQAGEWITTLGAYPSLAIGPLLDSHKHDTGVILRESLAAEAEALSLYRELLALVKD